MAWRIHDNVFRGEIDNRQRGKVRGKLWLNGLPSPLRLELNGNAAPDLAGCLLTFENPAETFPLPKEARLAVLQRGAIGDLTASRKVRLFDLPLQEALHRRSQGLAVPEHMANCLYLEWYSDTNGRVVVESTDYKLTISPPAWRLSPEEEKKRQRDAAKGFAGLIQKLTDALDSKKHQPPDEKQWDEFDYEKFMQECDARTDKYAELLDKYMDHPDRDHIIAREMGWTKLEQALDEREAMPFEKTEEAISPASDSSESDQDPANLLDFPEDVPELEPDPATEGIDWVRKKDGFITHPLVLRGLEGNTALFRKLKKLGLDQTEDEHLASLVMEYQITSAKLAGALDSLAYGRHLSEGAFIVACLKRALAHLHAAQAALDKVRPKKLLPGNTIKHLRDEFFALREEILRLMKEFRGEGSPPI